ncbi:MAG: phosphoenolpyruvate-protein phosphotransferase [Blastococcus sp.]|nr:phosphoenolpyruvate-protein phosphotransferase [Blastococcus sp.]
MSRHELAVIIRDPAGLHARPAARLVEEARRHESALRVVHAGAESALTSMIALLALGVRAGDEVVVRGDGPDSEDAVRAVAALLGDQGGDPAPAPAEAASPAEDSPVPPGDDGLRGVPASAGRAVGVIRHLSRLETLTADVPTVLEVEGVLTTVAARLRDQAQQADESSAVILEALAELALDPQLTAAARSRLATGLPLSEAFTAAGEDVAAVLERSQDSYLAARAADIRHLAADAAALALGRVIDVTELGEEPCILVASDVSPSLLSALGRSRLAGVVTEQGSASSHASLIASSLGVPMVVAVPDAVERLPHGVVAVVDGAAGSIELRSGAPVPTFEEAAGSEEPTAATPISTLDGHRIQVAVNVGSVTELHSARTATVDGVGLYRTELSYLSRTSAPSEDELTAELSEAVRSLAGQRLIVRTFDFGSDKQPPFLTAVDEPNPALGVRGIRLARLRPELLRAQLRAVSHAAQQGPVGVMAPMVTTVDDVVWFVDQVRQHVDPQAQVEVGVMLEVPAAALAAVEIVKHVDFVSVGTNDLVQYLNAADRQVGHLAGLQEPFAPVLLRLLKSICDAARANGTWVGICGAAAADPDWAALAVGLGVDELSVPPAAVARLRRRLTGVRLDELELVAAKALRTGTPEAVRDLARVGRPE